MQDKPVLNNRLNYSIMHLPPRWNGEAMALLSYRSQHPCDIGKDTVLTECTTLIVKLL